MADSKISALPNAATLVGAELVPLVQSGTNVKATVATLLAHAGGGGGGGGGGGAALGAIDVNTLSDQPFVTDGLTSNLGQFISLRSVLQSVGPEMPTQVNLTVGNPTVLSIDPSYMSGGVEPNPYIHGLKPNQAFHFIISEGGSLPAGVSLGTTYYVTRANLQQRSFTFSETNNYGISYDDAALDPPLYLAVGVTSEGPTVATSGAVSGGASFTATFPSVNFREMVVSAIASGTIIPGQTVSGAGVPAGVRVLYQVSGTPGGVGTYHTSNYTVALDTPQAMTTRTSVSIVLTGRDVSLLIPPGSYFGGTYGDNQQTYVTPNGITRIKYYAYGAQLDTTVNLGNAFFAHDYNHTSQVFDYVETTPNDNYPPTVQGIITLSTKANISRYYVGQWISILGLDVQNPYGRITSGPANPQYQEYKQITSIDVATGMIFVDGGLKWTYLKTFPNLANIEGPPTWQIGGGPAMIAGMSPSWDVELEVHGVRYVGQGSGYQARHITFKDCVYQGYADFPGVINIGEAQSLRLLNCRFGGIASDYGNLFQIDKWIEYLEFSDCTAPFITIAMESPSVQVCKLNNHVGHSIYGTPRTIEIAHSNLNELHIGPPIGVTDVCQVRNTRLGSIQLLNRDDDSNIVFRPEIDMTLVPSWSFDPVTGTFTRNMPSVQGTQATNWIIPGAKIYMTDAAGIYSYSQNMGSPFAILDTRMDGAGNLSFITTLGAIPARQTSSPVTISIPGGSVTWNAHGLAIGDPVCFTTTGALPTGLLTSTIYRVAASPAPTVNTFSVAAGLGGPAIVTSGTQSGTHTAFGNPLAFRPHPCTRFTSIGNFGCSTILDLNGAIDEPLYSRAKRSFVGVQGDTAGGSILSGLQLPRPIVWGNLTSERFMTVKVIKAATSGKLTISSPGFPQPNLTPLSPFTQVIDVTQRGVRTVTDTTVTGAKGADVLVPYADWIAGPLVFEWSSGMPTTAGASPVVRFTIRTDQGITEFENMWGAPSGSLVTYNLWQWNDSGLGQAFTP